MDKPSLPSQLHELSMNRKEYELLDQQFVKERNKVAQDPWRLGYHIMPESGWLNDPNGLCQLHGHYHIYYQYSPFDAEGNTKLWGHMTTKDFISYQQEEPVLYPDQRMDARGVYSGSAFRLGDELYFFYTGNVKLFDRDDYDYVHQGREQNTILVTSKDGYVFSEKECLMSNEDYPAGMSCHIRDPKIIERNHHYYMVLGARDAQDVGCVLMFQSEDLRTWTYHMNITTNEPFGYMWECPDLFELDGQLFLVLCPQGIAAEGINYANVHQCGYFPIDIAFEEKTYTLQDFHQLDRGFDFYAPQTFEDEQGRRILIGWMGMPDIPYLNPTQERGWQHALTIPRELHQRDGVLYQSPLQELQALRTKPRMMDAASFFQKTWAMKRYELQIQVESQEDFVLQLMQNVDLRYQAEEQVLTLSLGSCGYGRDWRSVRVKSLNNLQIFVDSSSLELFINQGQEVFTTRVYAEDREAVIQLKQGSLQGRVHCYELDCCSFQR